MGDLGGGRTRMTRAGFLLDFQGMSFRVERPAFGGPVTVPEETRSVAGTARLDLDPVYAASATRASVPGSGGDRAAARRRAPPARRSDRRRQEPRLSAPRDPARRNHARHLAAHLAHAGPGPGSRGARRRGHLPRLDPRCHRDAAPPRPARGRQPDPRLRRPGTARLPRLPRAPARPRLPAGRRRRGPLHQRVGS